MRSDAGWELTVFDLVHSIAMLIPVFSRLFGVDKSIM